VGDGTQSPDHPRSGVAQSSRTRHGVRGGLYEILQRDVPEHVLTPIATDVTQGWIMLPDGAL
jgi:hypothetical protein